MNSHTGYFVRRRINARIFHLGDGNIHKFYGRWKQKLLSDIPDSIVELGPATGTNFRYYRPGMLLTAIEPNQIMHDQMLRSAKQYRITLDIQGSRAEDIDLPDQSTDAVVATLVLCSVDQNQVLNQIYRILRPGGRLFFLEHVAAPKGTVLRRFQHILQKPWQWCFEGCNLTSEVESSLRIAGFSRIELEYFERKGFLSFPAKHHIVGIATK